MVAQVVEQNYLYDVKDFIFTGRNIRVHGNGFIQVDLPENKRLHVWGHPDIPRQVESSQIHSHRFGFESTILVGSLVNAVYKQHVVVDRKEYMDSELYDVYEPVQRTAEDTVLIKREQAPISLSYPSLAIYKAGERYSMNPKEIHETFVNQPTATLMTKLSVAPDDYKPEVFLPLGKTPDNGFNRYELDINEDRLWRIVMDVLRRGNGKQHEPEFFYSVDDARMLVHDSKYQYVFYTIHGYCLGMFSTSMQRWNMKNTTTAWWEVGKVPQSATHYVPYTGKTSFGAFDKILTNTQHEEMKEFLSSLNPNKVNFLFERT